MITNFLQQLNTNDILHDFDYDFYHLPSYLNLESSLIKGEAIIYNYENNGSKAFIPLIKRDISGSDYYDVISPYGYPGILINKEFNYRLYNNLVQSFIATCQSEQIVSAFIRLNPLLNNFLFNESKDIKQIIHGKTVFIDLTEKYEDIKSQYSSNHKRNIKKLLQTGFKVKINAWDQYEAWQSIYIKTMERLEASKYYLFDNSYFKQLKEILEQRLILATIHNEDDAVVAGGLFTVFNGVIQYHLGGTDENYLPVAPTKMMFDEIIKWGGDNGNKILHLGGGLNASADSLFNFKYGFSKNTFQFSTLRCVTNEMAYNGLVKQNFKEEADLNSINFFPLYRYNNS